MQNRLSEHSEVSSLTNSTHSTIPKAEMASYTRCLESGLNHFFKGGLNAVFRCYFLVPLLAAFALSDALGEGNGRVFADWETSAEGEPPLKEQQDLSIRWQSPGIVTVVNELTDPASPFPENGKAISVTKTEGVEGEARFLLKGQAFAAPAEEGWLEAELFIRTGAGIRLTFFNGGTLVTSGLADDEDRGEGLIDVNLRTEDGSYVTLVGRQANLFFSDNTPSDFPFVFRTSWAALGDTIIFTFELDGAPLLARNGDMASYVVRSTSKPGGVDFFTISGEEISIGKISVSKE
jgi:hypothetical protein